MDWKSLPVILFVFLLFICSFVGGLVFEPGTWQSFVINLAPIIIPVFTGWLLKYTAKDLLQFIPIFTFYYLVSTFGLMYELERVGFWALITTIILTLIAGGKVDKIQERERELRDQEREGYWSKL